MRKGLLILAMILAALPGWAQSGQLAFLASTGQEDQCCSILDLETRRIHPVGPGKRDGAPRWAPDGQWLAFESAQPQGLGVYVVRASGDAGRFINEHYEWNHSPRWAAEGHRLAYSSDSEMGMRQVLMVYDLDTAKEEVWGGSDHLGMQRPIWMPSLDLMKALSPDTDLSWEGVDTATLLEEAHAHGALLAVGFVGKPGALSTEIFLVTRTQRIPLLPLIKEDTARYVEWGVEMNRKGQRIAYESNDGGDREIFVISKRGLTDISNHRAADWNPVWSPDGYWLAFESFRGGRRGRLPRLHHHQPGLLPGRFTRLGRLGPGLEPGQALAGLCLK